MQYSAQPAADADKDILDPETDHVQHIADNTAALQIFHVAGCLAAVLVAFFLLGGMSKARILRAFRLTGEVFTLRRRIGLDGIQNTEAPFRV